MKNSSGICMVFEVLSFIQIKAIRWLCSSLGKHELRTCGGPVTARQITWILIYSKISTLKIRLDHKSNIVLGITHYISFISMHAMDCKSAHMLILGTGNITSITSGHPQLPSSYSAAASQPSSRPCACRMRNPILKRCTS